MTEEFVAKHLLVEDSFDLPGKGTVISTTVLKDRWDVEVPAWENAKAVEIDGQRFQLLGCSYATNKFHNCLTGWPTNFATFFLILDGHFPRGHFRRGAAITLCH